MTDELHGLLNMRKPGGVSSFWVVKQVRRALGVKKAGHCGTLDPLAEGVLLVVFGKATKLQSACMASRKVYATRLKLGIVTDSGDITGAERERKPVGVITEEAVRTVLADYTGAIEQVPPMFSALKVNGQRLYKLAREGREVERKPRLVTIDRIDLLSLESDTLELRVVCSAGTYIRTLAEDIGARLGCGATVASLCREQVGEFSLADSLTIDEMRKMVPEEVMAKAVPLEMLQEKYGSARLIGGLTAPTPGVDTVSEGNA